MAVRSLRARRFIWPVFLQRTIDHPTLYNLGANIFLCPKVAPFNWAPLECVLVGFVAHCAVALP